ncbi:hypothetical protein C7M84_024336 [Penaeus vannamei]|uniref:Uncharacterized protein n=2 Tax=Penaeus vannamei TaxID=6689 RepID=A0A3R7QLC2_PENVA|nr:hypothetical protein C7M84_024336 [Penaeus vannamei]
MQWLDLDEIVIDDIGDRQERRVKFTADTYNPNSMRRDVGGSHQNRSFPGAVVRQFPTDEGETTEGNNPKSRDSSEVDRRGIWTTSESYRERFKEAPKGTVGRERRQQLWESYYGTGGHLDRTLPRHLAPHPNSKAPFCGKPGNCHDFTLDLYRSAKLRQRSEARRRRRRCYAVVLIVAALVAFLGAVVTISWYYTGGQKFFGSM